MKKLSQSERQRRHWKGIQELRRAWYDAGKEPSFHYNWQWKLRREWPVLYKAIQKLI